MRPSNTGKSDPQQQPAPTKRGFFASAGERLKRAMSGPRVPDAAAAASAQAAPEGGDGADGDTTSVQSKARELLLQDRTHRRGQAPVSASDAHDVQQRRTTPPPLPSQRMAAGDAVGGGVERAERNSSARPKRPVRDSKSEALRARLGAAKAAMADAQAKRAAAEASAPEPVALSEDAKPQPPPLPVAEAVSGNAQAQPPTAAVPSESEDEEEDAEPIRTLTIARLLARQGYYDRSLSIYDQLLGENAEDPELRAEADRVRAQQSGDQPRESGS